MTEKTEELDVFEKFEKIKDTVEKIDIHSKGWNDKIQQPQPPEEVQEISKRLSNFYPHAFVFDGVKCASMEGFLQSLKYKCPEKQREICTFTGKEAKEKGDGKIRWRLMHKAYWKGEAYDRLSPEYRALILRAYRTMYEQNEDFRKALIATRGIELYHSVGKPNPKQTILTEREFICCLYKCRIMRVQNIKPQGTLTL